MRAYLYLTELSFCLRKSNPPTDPKSCLIRAGPVNAGVSKTVPLIKSTLPRSVTDHRSGQCRSGLWRDLVAYSQAAPAETPVAYSRLAESCFNMTERSFGRLDRYSISKYMKNGSQGSVRQISMVGPTHFSLNGFQQRIGFLNSFVEYLKTGAWHHLPPAQITPTSFSPIPQITKTIILT